MKKSSLKSSTFALALRQNGLSTMTAALRHWVHAILPLSSCSRSTRMFLRGIMCCALIVVFVSCKSLDTTTVDTHHSSLIAHHSTDTIVIRDSIFIREMQKGDTIYLTRLEFRDRWRTQLVHDTIVHTDTIVQVIEHPPERYIPPFYKHCTTILFIIFATGIVYLVIRWRLHF